MPHKYFTEHRPKDFLSYRRDDLKSTIHAGNPHAHPGPDRHQSRLVTPKAVGASVRMVGVAQPERQAQRNELSGCASGTRASRRAAFAAGGPGATQTNASRARDGAVSAGAGASMFLIGVGRSEARSRHQLEYQSLAPME